MILPIKDDNPTRRFPVLTLGILVANVGAFLYLLSLGTTGFEASTQRLGAIPFEIAHATDAISPTPIPLAFTLLTAMFLHGGWWHLGGNMLYLWIFGNNVEDRLGHFRFLVFYLVCGLVATLAHVASDPDSTAPMVGASGAIAGILGAYLAAFPGARIYVLVIFHVVRVPALIVLGVWFIIQLSHASADGGGTGGGVAWYAHIAGFVVGFLLMRRLNRRRNRVFGIHNT